MLPIHIQAAAENDLIGIWEYTYHQWGEIQADHYLDILNQSIQTISHHPNIGVNYNHVRSGYRRLSIQHYSVFYTISDEQIDFIPVLFRIVEIENR